MCWRERAAHNVHAALKQGLCFQTHHIVTVAYKFWFGYLQVQRCWCSINNNGRAIEMHIANPNSHVPDDIMQSMRLSQVESKGKDGKRTLTPLRR